MVLTDFGSFVFNALFILGLVAFVMAHLFAVLWFIFSLIFDEQLRYYEDARHSKKISLLHALFHAPKRCSISLQCNCNRHEPGKFDRYSSCLISRGNVVMCDLDSELTGANYQKSMISFKKDYTHGGRYYADFWADSNHSVVQIPYKCETPKHIKIDNSVMAQRDDAIEIPVFRDVVAKIDLGITHNGSERNEIYAQVSYFRKGRVLSPIDTNKLILDFRNYQSKKQKEYEEKIKSKNRAYSGGDYCDDDRTSYPVTGRYDPEAYYSASSSERDLCYAYEMTLDELKDNVF